MLMRQMLSEINLAVALLGSELCAGSSTYCQFGNPYPQRLKRGMGQTWPVTHSRTLRSGLAAALLSLFFFAQSGTFASRQRRHVHLHVFPQAQAPWASAENEVRMSSRHS